MKPSNRLVLATLLGLIVGNLAGCPSQTGGLELTLGTDATGGRPAPNATSDVQGASSVGLQPADSNASDTLATQFPDCNEPTNVAALRTRIFELVNQERGKLGLTQLVPNQTLENQAEEYACEMISEDFFAHVNPVTHSTLRDRSAQFGYRFQVVGENLAAGQSTPERVFLDWMDSPTHRDNIIDPRFTELGVGIRLGGHYGIYWVQEFGKPAAP